MKEKKHKFLRRVRKATVQLWERAKGGSAADIALLVFAVALSAALMTGLVYTGATLFTGGKSPSGSLPTSGAPDEIFNPNDYAIAEENQAVILPAGTDAGAEYLRDTLFVGDSNTARMLLYNGPVTLDNNIGVTGMGIQHTLNTPAIFFEDYNENKPVLVPEAVKVMQPRRVVLNFGTNDTTMSADTFAENYGKTIDSIQDAYPYTDIIVCAVPPVARQRSYPDITMQSVAEFNQALAQLCDEKELPFLNASEVLSDESGFAKENYTVSDGIHLSETGMNALWEYARTHPHETQDTRPARTPVPKHLPTPEDFLTSGGTPAVSSSSSDTSQDSSSSASASSKAASSSSSKKTSSSSKKTSSSSKKAVSSSKAPTSSQSVAVSSSSAPIVTPPPVSTVTPPASSSAPECVHDFSKIVSTNQQFACVEGTRTVECTKCGAQKQEVMPAQTHTPGKTEVTDPTATKPGLSTVYCSVCNAVISETILPAHKHMLYDADKKEATCTEKGYVTQKCTVEGCTHSITQFFDALGHIDANGDSICDRDSVAMTS